MDLEQDEITDLTIKFSADLMGAREEKSTKSFTIVTLLETLGGLLTDTTSVGRRQRGLAILSSVISKLPEDFLPVEECQLLSDFYSDRTKDHHSLNPEMISGMYGLVLCHNIDGPSIRKIIQTYFNEINTQTQMLQERKQVFKLLSELLKTKLELILPMGNDFVLGFIQAVDGEKDPNNLLLVFGCVPIIIQNFPLEPFTEDLFETVARYFPIDFTPPRLPLGHKIVTKSELVDALRNCFASDKSLAPLTIPLFLEKLDSDLEESKIDANLSLIDCLQSGYTPQQIKPHLEELWNVYKKEIMGFKLGKASSKDEEVRNTSISAVNAITRQLALPSIDGLNVPEDSQILNHWIQKIWEDCGRHLKDIVRSGGEELTLTSTSVGLLSALTCGAGEYTSTYILDKAMPIILEAVQKASLDEEHIRSLRLNYVTKLIDGCSISQSPRPSWYDAYLHECIVSAFATTPGESKNNKVGCLALVAGMHFIEKKDAENIFDQLFKQTVQEERPLNDAEKHLLTALITKINYIRPNTEEVEAIFTDLFTENPKQSDKKSSVDILAVCCQFKSILDKEIFPRIVTNLPLIKHDVSKLHICIRVLQYIWDIHKDLAYFINSDRKDDSASILQHLTQLSLSADFFKNEENFDSVINSLRRLLSCIALFLNEEHAEVVQNIVNAYITSGVGAEDHLVANKQFFICETLICFANKKLLDCLESKIYQAIFSNKTDMLLEEYEEKDRLAIFKIRAAIFNKFSDISKYSDEIYAKCVATQSKQMRTNTIWLINGLFSRPGYFKINPWIQLLQRWLDELTPSCANELADEISNIIITPPSNIENSFFNYRESALGLSRQKFFLVSKQGLIASYHKDINKSAQMKALISQLPHIPKFLLTEEMSSFIPLLINVLKCNGENNSDELVLSTLDALYDLMQQDLKSFAGILLHFLNAWLDLSTSKYASVSNGQRMNIRIKALECVENSVKCLEPKDVVLQRKEVLKKLSISLDDRKRLVRKSASNAKNAWCLAS